MIELNNIEQARIKLRSVALQTPLQRNTNLSDYYNANVFLKREDLQIVRSYKIRGAYNKISSLNAEQLSDGIVCASAGNHAQGVALSCKLLNTKGHIFMPVTTPKQKVDRVKFLGKDNVEVILAGDTFDDSCHEALQFSNENRKIFIHPFDDLKIIEGQATVALEVLEDAKFNIDYLLLPVGGGGLAAGVSSVFKLLSPATKIIGIEPNGAPSMKTSIERGENTTLETMDTFVDGAAVKRVGNITFNICRKTLDRVITVSEGKICSTILKMYNEEAIVLEPAGALSISALDLLADEIKGLNVICVVSGSNNDISRMEEIRERSLLYEGLKHYFIIRFPQRAGALREFLDTILTKEQDITHFEYSKKNNREKGTAFIGIELKQRNELKLLLFRMEKFGLNYEYLNDRADILHYFL